MTKKNPDDSVREEHIGADEKASVREKPTQAEKADENVSSPDDMKTEPEVRENIKDEKKKPVKKEDIF